MVVCMIDVIQYQFITPYNYTKMFLRNASPLAHWLAFGKLAENPIITPSKSDQVVEPSAANRYLESVTVKATA